MQIFVKICLDASKTVTVDVAPSDDVSALVVKVADKTGLPADTWRLLVAGRQLEDGRPLSTYAIQKESTVHLMSRLRGSGGADRSPLGNPVSVNRVADKKAAKPLLRGESFEVRCRSLSRT